MPSHLFHESNCKTSPPKHNSDGKSSSFSRQRNAELADKSIQSKNKTIEFCVLSETCTKVSNAVTELNGTKRKLYREFTDEVCNGDKKRGKNRIQKFIDAKEREENKENINTNDSLSGIDLYDAPESQETFLQEIYDIHKEIVEQTKIRDVAKTSLLKKSDEM